MQIYKGNHQARAQDEADPTNPSMQKYEGIHQARAHDEVGATKQAASLRDGVYTAVTGLKTATKRKPMKMCYDMTNPPKDQEKTKKQKNTIVKT